MTDMSAYYARKQQGVTPLMNYFQGVKQDQATASAAEQQQKQDEQRRKMAALVEMMRANPAHIPEIMASNPEAFNGVQFDPSKFQQTPSEKFGGMVTQDAMNQFPNLPRSVRQQGTYQMGYGAAMPSESVKMTNAQDVYAHPQSFDPQMQTRQGVEDKTQLNAEELAKEHEWREITDTVTVPESKAKVRETDATTGLRTAETAFTAGPKTRLTNAETGKATAETGLAQAKTGALSSTGTDPETGQLSPDLARKRDLLVNRQASLDSVTKGSKNPNERAILLAAMPPGLKPAMNDKELETVRQAEGKADLIGHRIDRLVDLAGVVDKPGNRFVIANTLNQAQGGVGALTQGMLKNIADPKVRQYVYELQQLREEIIGYRQYFGNSPVRSDKQVALLTGQVPDGTMGSAADVLDKLKSFAPVSTMIQRMYNLPPSGNTTLPPAGGKPAAPTQTNGRPIIRYDAQGNRIQ